MEERTEALKKLSEAVEHSPVTVVITDKNGAIEYVNPEFSEVTGYSSEEAIGQNPSILKSGNFPDSFYQNLWDTILSGKTWRGEFLNRKKNDEEFWESASISPIKNDEGEITHFVAVKQDITEKKQIEEELVKSKRAAEDANKAKSDFLANMSHEIRTPMNAVIGMAHLALKTELTTKQRDYVDKIQSSANSLLGIINDILDFSKIEAGKLDIEAVEFDLSQTLDNVANVVAVKAQEKENLEVLFHVDSRVPNFLIGDPLRLNQILVNLGNNAVKFTERGEILLMTKVNSESGDKITLQFSVRDTGLGLTDEQQTKLFEGFLLKPINPSILFDTIMQAFGEAVPELLRVAQRKEKEGKAWENIKGSRVLLVEDNEINQQVAREILQGAGVNVTIANNGQEGVDAARTNQYDVILMDIQMPVMDGYAATRKIREWELKAQSRGQRAEDSGRRTDVR